MYVYITNTMYIVRIYNLIWELTNQTAIHSFTSTAPESLRYDKP